MNDIRERRLWKFARWTWLFSTSGTIITSLALAVIYFLIIPLSSHAVGVNTALTTVNETAAVLENIAEGGVVRMLLVALIISLLIQSACMFAIIKLLFKSSDSPLFIRTELGKSVIRDVIRECWNDIRREFEKK